MPTPFYHLSIASELIHHPSLAYPIRVLLESQRCAFLFGNTAPDVQVISGQSREETHFFSLPIQAIDRPAWEVLCSNYPHLAVAERLPTRQAAFLAGYLCHIQADWLWIKQIFAPFFGPGCTWGTFPERLYYHNVLRAYLDQQILPELGNGMFACLRQVQPEAWLPFVKDQPLRQWGDFLSSQLEPGAVIRTVEVFSSRQGISAPEYYALLCSIDRMQKEVFEHVPLEWVQRYRKSVLDENVQLLSSYVAFALHPNRLSLGSQPAEGESQ